MKNQERRKHPKEREEYRVAWRQCYTRDTKGPLSKLQSPVRRMQAHETKLCRSRKSPQMIFKEYVTTKGDASREGLVYTF